MWKKISENLKQEDSFLSYLLKEQQWIFFLRVISISKMKFLQCFN